jgi:hypothetical protein
MTRAHTTNPTRLRWLATAPLFAAAVALGSAGYPAIANAAPPGTWDIEEYDGCVNQFEKDQMNLSLNDIEAIERGCCAHSGGVWSEAMAECVAPPGQGPPQNRQTPSGVGDNPQVAPPPPQAPPPRDPSRIPQDNTPINPGTPATTPVPSPS